MLVNIVHIYPLSEGFSLLFAVRKYTPTTPQHCCSYVAFYADCIHEVELVTRGYRLALVYNLLFTSPNKPAISLISEDIVDQTRNCLIGWSAVKRPRKVYSL